MVLHSIDNFLISQSNLPALQKKGSLEPPLFKGDKKNNTMVSISIMLLSEKKTLSDKNENVAHPKQVKYFLDNKFPIEQLRSKNKIFLKKSFLFYVGVGKRYCFSAPNSI